jgi:hypothetical protein
MAITSGIDTLFKIRQTAPSCKIELKWHQELGICTDDRPLIQQTEPSLATIKKFASQSNNDQLLSHIQHLESELGALTAVGDTISVGDISGSTAVAIGHDINIIINQVLPPAEKQPLESV